MQDAASYCAELVRTADRDRFIAGLFVPAHRRDALYALYALDVEIGRVRDRGVLNVGARRGECRAAKL